MGIAAMYQPSPIYCWMAENAEHTNGPEIVATFGGRSAFLRLVPQPQNEIIAAGGQCTSAIWVIANISPSALPAAGSFRGSERITRPGERPDATTGAQHRVIAQMRKDGDDLAN